MFHIDTFPANEMSLAGRMPDIVDRASVVVGRTSVVVGRTSVVVDRTSVSVPVGSDDRESERPNAPR